MLDLAIGDAHIVSIDEKISRDDGHDFVSYLRCEFKLGGNLYFSWSRSHFVVLKFGNVVFKLRMSGLNIRKLSTCKFPFPAVLVQLSL